MSILYAISDSGYGLSARYDHNSSTFESTQNWDVRWSPKTETGWAGIDIKPSSLDEIVVSRFYQKKFATLKDGLVTRSYTTIGHPTCTKFVKNVISFSFVFFFVIFISFILFLLSFFFLLFFFCFLFFLNFKQSPQLSECILCIESTELSIWDHRSPTKGGCIKRLMVR